LQERPAYKETLEPKVLKELQGRWVVPSEQPAFAVSPEFKALLVPESKVQPGFKAHKASRDLRVFKVFRVFKVSLEF